MSDPVSLPPAPAELFINVFVILVKSPGPRLSPATVQSSNQNEERWDENNGVMCFNYKWTGECPSVQSPSGSCRVTEIYFLPRIGVNFTLSDPATASSAVACLQTILINQFWRSVELNYKISVTFIQNLPWWALKLFTLKTWQYFDRASKDEQINS